MSLRTSSVFRAQNTTDLSRRSFLLSTASANRRHVISPTMGGDFFRGFFVVVEVRGDFLSYFSCLFALVRAVDLEAQQPLSIKYRRGYVQ